MSPIELSRILNTIESALAERFGAGPGDVKIFLREEGEVRVVVDGAHGHLDCTIHLARGRDVTYIASFFGISL